MKQEAKKPASSNILDEQLEMALRALEIKYHTIKQRAKRTHVSIPHAEN